jgi:Icc-related predicted phosphoesterase
MSPKIEKKSPDNPNSRERVRLGIIGDVHGEQGRLSKVVDVLAELEVDGVLLVGDLISHAWAREHGLGPRARETFDAEIEQTLSRVAPLGVPTAWVPGNHDLPGVDLLPDRSGPVSDPASEPPWLRHAPDLDRRVGEVAGLRVYGVGGAGPARFGFPYEWDEAEIDALDMPEVDVILSHTPPARSGLDRVMNGRMVGSEAVRRLCKKAHLLVCGHIHEAAGLVEIDGCLCLNAGALGEPYGRSQVAWVDFSRHEAPHELGWAVEGTHLDLVGGRRQSLGSRVEIRSSLTPD